MVVLLGYQLYETARADYGMSVAEASFQLGLLGLAQFIPLFLLTPVAGLAADRFDRRHVAAFANGIDGGVAVLLAVMTWADALTIPILFGLAAAHGCTIRLAYDRGYPALITTAAESAFAADVARAVVGDDKVDPDIPPVMGGEDFAYMLEARPGSFVRLGTGRGPDTPLVHHPRYDFNDEALPIGASFWVKLVETALPRRA